jgi:hypothetical protein
MFPLVATAFLLFALLACFCYPSCKLRRLLCTILTALSPTLFSNATHLDGKLELQFAVASSVILKPAHCRLNALSRQFLTNINKHHFRISLAGQASRCSSAFGTYCLHFSVHATIHLGSGNNSPKPHIPITPTYLSPFQSSSPDPIVSSRKMRYAHSIIQLPHCAVLRRRRRNEPERLSTNGQFTQFRLHHRLDHTHALLRGFRLHERRSMQARLCLWGSEHPRRYSTSVSRCALCIG